jgi:hypothetical protein
LDAPFLGDKGVPGFAAGIDDSFIVGQQAVREVALPQVEPDPLGIVTARWTGWSDAR